jgi:cysteine synthase A
MQSVGRSIREDRAWLEQAIAKIRSEANRSADTHLLSVPIPLEWGIDLYLKDESTHPTGSLKHRLARSLFLYALSNGRLHERTTIIEASSGSTAVSEAYFARLLDLPFVAVVPRSTSPEKLALIEAYGGRCHLVDLADEARATASMLARDVDGHFMDQFTNAERATDWRGGNNIATSIFDQMAMERFPIPEWIVVGAGTGGTSATIGRYLRYSARRTQLCVADPVGSVYFDAWRESDFQRTVTTGSLIEGIGRPRVEPSFIPSVVDRMTQVPDAASIACLHYLERVLGRRVGGSTGTNLWTALAIIAQMRKCGERGSVVTLLCDGGDRYASTLYDDLWLQSRHIDIAPYLDMLNRFEETGQLEPSWANSETESCETNDSRKETT